MKPQKKNAPKKTSSGTPNVRAVDRAVDILRAFTPEQPAMSVLELQKRVGLSRPTLYRILQTLSKHGLINAEGDPQRFKLGHGVMHLANTWMKGLDVIELARPVVEQVRDQTGETCALFSLDGDRRVCVLEAPSRTVLSITRGVGETSGIVRGATGHAILAHLDDARVATLLRGAPDKQRAEAAIAFARRHGYARSHGEVIVGAVAVAAPYFDHRGAVIGSIGLYGPAARIGDNDLAKLGLMVVDAAARLSVLLGNPGGRDNTDIAEAPARRRRSEKVA